MEPFNLFLIVLTIFGCLPSAVSLCVDVMNDIAHMNKIINNLKKMNIMLMRDLQNGAFTSELDSLAYRNYQECLSLTQIYPPDKSQELMLGIIASGVSFMLIAFSAMTDSSFKTRTMVETFFVTFLIVFNIANDIKRIRCYICTQKSKKIINFIHSIIARATLDPGSQLSGRTMPPESILMFRRILMD